MKARYRRWLQTLEAHRLDGFLVSHPPNLRYLFNFTGSAGLALCLGAEAHLIVDSRYMEQSRLRNRQLSEHAGRDIPGGHSQRDTLEVQQLRG